MDNYIYYQLDTNNICVAVSSLNQEVKKQNMIKSKKTYQNSISDLGKIYENKTFRELTEEERARFYPEPIEGEGEEVPEIETVEGVDIN